MKLRKKILLIDREPRVTRVVRQALECAGPYCIREEHDTAFALRTVRWFRPDLILVDLTDAARGGELFARELRDCGDTTPLLCVTSFLSDRQFVSAGVISGYTFLVAPLGIEQLVRGVEQLLFGSS